MKRKFVSVLLALVLVVSFSLVTAVPVAAATTFNVIPYTLGFAGGDAAEWSTANTAPSGSYSAKLTHTASASAHAWVQFTPPTGISLAEFVAAPTTYGFTYWRTEDKAGPLLEMRFTDGGDALAEITVDMALYDYLSSATPLDPGQWIVKTASATEQCMYYGEDSEDVGLTGTGTPGDLSDLITDIAAGAVADDAAAVGAWEMTRVRVDLGWVADTQDSAWVDDVIIDGVTYDLEGTADDYTVIQTAITAANPGDTISVAAGTYREDLSISTANLTLESVAGAATTIIYTAGSVNDIVIVTAADVTIDDFTIQGDNATSGAVNGIDLRNSGFTIQNNIFTDIYYDNILVSGDMTSGTITENTFTGMGEAAGRGAIWVESYDYDISGITISNNIVSNYGAANKSTITVAQTQVGTVSDITVTGNSVTDGIYGLSLYNGGTGSTMDAISVTDNTFSRCVIGIMSWPSTANDPTNVVITGNDITGNTEDGILIDSWDATNAINNNNISGNTLKGINNTTGTTVDATNNWWGDASGPADAVKYAATGYEAYGDNVSANVDYEPWLLAVVTEVTPTTYDKTLALKDGWTLVSTDKEVTTDTAWVGTTVLSGTDTILAYKYTPGTGYPQVTEATLLTSVDAYYIKTDGGGGVGINYSTDSPGVVTKTLSAGWNIISCAAETDAYELLSPLRYVQIGEQEGTGLTSLVGQASYNQYLATTFSDTLVTEAEWAAIVTTPVTLNAFDGYWVYMNAGKSFGVIPD